MAVKSLEQSIGSRHALYRGDCVDVLRGLPSNSIHFTIFSPPFVALYTFSDDPRDMSNCRKDEDFFTHYGFFAEQIARVCKPGRLVAVHCMNLPALKSRHGYIGVRDFRGEIIRAHEKTGMIYHSEVCIWKDPVTAMQRTKSIRLLHKQLIKDSTVSGQGLADYLVVFGKPGVNDEPVAGPLTRYFGSASDIAKVDPKGGAGHVADSYSVKVWQRYASPVWDDIDQSDVLSRKEARDNADERHIAPLQLTIIRRALDLWTNENDIVLDPFAGIGSAGYVAIQMDRRFIGVELKASYYKQAVRNVTHVTKGFF